MTRSTKETAHTRAFRTHFELSCEVSFLIVVSDLIWLAHDITNYGLNVWYAVVLIGLLSGTVLTAAVLIRHHTAYVRRYFSKHITKHMRKKVGKK